MQTRRHTLLAGLGLAGLGLAAPGLLAGTARADALETRALGFHNLHTGEALTIEYWQNGVVPEDAAAAISHVLRDHRTGETHPIDLRLLDLLHALSLQIPSLRPFQVISGYRSPQTNATLANASAGVARRSLHMQGMAIDIAVEGVATSTLRNAALAMNGGGVGYYPDPGFVHIDVGRVRQW
ncbi:MAG: DUF882 domain-containing protein [Alphaproteobacteria bacterium]|jgi:uncharacterized protein YcbK (DUF882 family)|nr:DUF882 domain-containing protein [Alphaproteobacteria bacterium]